jgi:hypothetical protein
VRTRDTTQGKVVLPGHQPLHFISFDRSPVRLWYVHSGVASTQQTQERAMVPGQQGIAPDKFTVVY